MITLAQVKQELDITNTNYDDLIEFLNGAVVQVWEEMTNKKWAEGTFKETFTEKQGGCVYLQAMNPTRVYSVGTGLDSALEIYGQNPSLLPTVTITDTALILYDAITGETELTFADYPTLTELSDAINLVANWSAFAYPGYLATLSKSLIEVSGQFCESSGTDFNIPDEYASGIKFDKRLREITIPSEYVAPIVVSYKAGYTDTTCPAWLQQILIRQSCHWYQQAVEKRWNVSSMTLGDSGTISYGEQKGNLLSEFVTMAAKHKRVVI